MLSLHLEGTNKRKGRILWNCKIQKKSTACNVQWSHRLYIENQEERNTKINLNIHGQQIVSQLFALSGLHEEADIDMAKLTYDSQSHKLIDIDPIKI